MARYRDTNILVECARLDISACRLHLKSVCSSAQTAVYKTKKNVNTPMNLNDNIMVINQSHTHELKPASTKTRLTITGFGLPKLFSI